MVGLLFLNEDTMKNYHWNAEDYARNSAGQAEWAQGLMSKLDLAGGEKLLDIGCGDGKITVQLAEKLSRGKVVGVDSSYEMVGLAKGMYKCRENQNLRFLMADFRSLPFYEHFDIVFSNAPLHWVRDHKTVLWSIYRALAPGGRILLQMGGKGNAAGILRVLNRLMEQTKWREYFNEFKFPYGFYAPQEYEAWLQEAGFDLKRIETIDKLMRFANADKLTGLLRTSWLPYTERIPGSLRDEFIQSTTQAYLQENSPKPDGTILVAMGTVGS